MKIENLVTNNTATQNALQDQQKVSSNMVGDTKQAEIKENSSTCLDETISSVEKANKMLFKNNTHLKFEVNEECDRVIVRIIDDETGEVLKEIPDEDFVEMMHKLCEIAGIFVDERC